MKFTHTEVRGRGEVVANVIGLKLELVMNGALFYASVGNVGGLIDFRYVCMHDKHINADQNISDVSNDLCTVSQMAVKPTR